MITEVILPKLGQTMEEGAIVEWVKQEGDAVQRGDVLFTVESDKATLEVEATKRGYLRKILVPAGELVAVLSPVGLITKSIDEDISSYGAEGGSDAARTERAADLVAVDSEVLPEEDELTSRPSGERIFASPRARRAARDESIELAQIVGTGPNGRIVERDVLAYVESQPRVSPVARRLADSLGVALDTVAGTGPGGRIVKSDVERAAVAAAPIQVTPEMPQPPATVPQVEETPLSGIRAVIARRMYESHQTTAPVTLTMEVDATELVEVRERLKAQLADQLAFNIGYNDLLIVIAARALRELPYMNVRLVGDAASGAIQRRSQIDVALAVDTDRGLLVPVVRNADRKGLAEVAVDLRALIERVRDGSASPDDLTGSTFTITNLGMFEVDAFTPIINLPEAAILGVGRIKPQPIVAGGEICVRKMMWLSLTFDHRLVDGAPAARFLQRIKTLIEEPMLLLA